MIKIGYPVRKDLSNMSFVGIHNTNEGLIAFADSKATRKFNDGHCEEDIKRGKIRKVFKNNKFICVTHGNNELFSSKNKMNIEDYFNIYLKEEHYVDFFRRLFTDLLKDSPEYNDGIYNFIIGSKDSQGFYILDLTIDVNNNKINYSEPDYKKKVYYAGDKRYVLMYDIIQKYTNLPIKEYSQTIVRQVNLMVNLFNTEEKYNPVGLPINSEIFQ